MSRTLKPARAVTLNDVAEAGGVSHQTVSRVVSSSAHVFQKTCERVLLAVAELGYRPKPAARQLVTGISKTAKIIGFDSSYYGPALTANAPQFGMKRYEVTINATFRDWVRR